MQHMLWFTPDGHGRYARTWESKADPLHDDSCLQEMGATSFHKFMQEDDFVKTLLTANDDETCAFVSN
jgi:hypothetical protein